MHSFHPSHGRVLFEVLCALGMTASLAGAWMQTGASALLAAAGVAALYGLVHLFDLRRPEPAMVVEPQQIAFEPEAQDIIVPMAAVEDRPAVESVGEVVEEAAPRAANGRRSGGSRKGSGRRGKTPKAPKVVEAVPAEEVAAPWPLAEEASVAELAEPGEELAFMPDGPGHPHIEPLFEPEPFVRMPRRAFGRKSG